MQPAASEATPGNGAENRSASPSGAAIAPNPNQGHDFGSIEFFFLVCTWLVLRVPSQYSSTQTGLPGQAEKAVKTRWSVG